MNDNDTLLSFIARHHASGLEDVATNTLFFILSRSDSARAALSDFLGDEHDPLPIKKTQTWVAVEHGAEPDMVCLDEDDNKVAFIEAKFWAPLTHHQPVTYWEALPGDRPSVLLFLAPDYRISQGPLWGELVDLLREAGHELRPPDRSKSLVTASAKVGQRRLMLASWYLLLDTMAERTKEDGDTQASFEIAELQGLAAGAIANDRPTTDVKLKSLIAQAVERLEQSGWANTDGLDTGGSHGVYFARYLRLAGVSAGLRIDYPTAKMMPDKPLWLWLYGEPDDRVGMEEVRSTLGTKARSGLEWRPGNVCLPVALPPAADSEATLDAIVGELKRIAKLIDPNGPTYREAL